MEEAFDKFKRGKKKLDQESLNIVWDMKYKSGTLSVNGLKNGQIICTEELTSAGKPNSMLLKPTVIHSDKFNYDLIQVEVNMVDKNNSITPECNPKVEFILVGEGQIIRACNSNYQSTESYKTNSCRLHEGRCLVIIKTNNKENLKLNARSLEFNKECTVKF